MKTPDQTFEIKPRFIGCPPICIRVNLPTFKTEKELHTFAGKNHPSISVVKTELCKFCGHFHYTTEKAEEKPASESTEQKPKTAQKPESKPEKSVGIPTRPRQGSMF